LEHLVDLQPTVPIIHDNRLVQRDPSANSRKIGFRQATRSDFARVWPHHDCGGIKPMSTVAMGFTDFDPDVEPSFAVIHTAIGNPVSRGGNLTIR
jgi:hypothetical protein